MKAPNFRSGVFDNPPLDAPAHEIVRSHTCIVTKVAGRPVSSGPVEA